MTYDVYMVLGKPLLAEVDLSIEISNLNCKSASAEYNLKTN